MRRYLERVGIVASAIFMTGIGFPLLWVVFCLWCPVLGFTRADGILRAFYGRLIPNAWRETQSRPK